MTSDLSLAMPPTLVNQALLLHHLRASLSQPQEEAGLMVPFYRWSH